ncbi:MAG: alpha/beta hydrolase, partial [Deinococcus sp.]
VLHGAYDSKEGKLGVYSALCASGVGVVIPDAALHGERSVAGLTPQEMGERNFVWTAAARTSHGMAALISALQETFGPLPLWAVGSSMGGYTAQFLALTEPRVSRVACLISAGVWQDPAVTAPEALEYLGRFRPVQHAALAPPTRLLLQNGSDDPLFGPEAVGETARAYRRAYQEAGCPQHFTARAYPGVAHSTSVPMRDEAVAFVLEGLATGRVA